MRRLLTALAVLSLCVSPALAKKKKRKKRREARQERRQSVRPIPASWKDTLRFFNPRTANNDATNAYLASAFARLVYVEDDHIVEWARGMGCDEVKLEREKGKAMLLCADDRMVLIAVEGSNPNSRDFKRACNADYRNKTLGGRVHKGGFDLSKKLRGKAEAFIQRSAHRRKPVFLAGHSMGGLAAVFIGAHLKRHLRRAPRAMFTFGMPRMGNRTFRQNLDIPAHHYVNRGDGVALLYPAKFHPNGSVWMLSENGQRVQRTKVSDTMTKKWFKQWGSGFNAVLRKSTHAHSMPVYQQHLYRQVPQARRDDLPEPKRL